MKNLISVVYLQTNSASGEKLAVGLLATGENGTFFKAAENKLLLAKKLVGEEATKQAQWSLQLMEKEAQADKKQYDGLFEKKSAFNKKYLDYLNQYSQGLLKFEAPKAYAETLDKATFKKLFNTFIESWEETEGQKTKAKSFHSILKAKLKKPAIQQKADIDYKLKPELIPGLLLPQEVSLISKNGNILAVQAIDFNNSIEVIAKHVNETELMVTYLEQFGKDHIPKYKKGNYNLLFNKPAAGSAQESLLNTIKKTKKGLMKIEELAYMDEIENQLEQKDYHKFSLFAENI